VCITVQAQVGGLPVIKNRLKELRKARGLTLEKLAELSGVSVSQINRIERQTRGWSVESLPKLAKALGVSVSELIDASQAWTEVPVFGVLGHAIWVKLKPLGIAPMPTVKIPAAIGEVLALTISGSSLYPRYSEGDVVAVTEASQDPLECIGRECLVGVDTGYYALKVVQPNRTPGHFMLTSHNEPPVMDRKLVTCRPVVYVGR
jgi:DNA-binding XRE family transcriptional regulator